jgi:hypothetical protein
VPSLRSILITAVAATSALGCPAAMASGGSGGGGGGGGGTAPGSGPCLRIASFSAQGQNTRGGILEKDVVENCGTAPITFRYHLAWTTTSGTNGALDKLETLPAKGKQSSQRVITRVTPFRTYLVQLTLRNVKTGAFYDVESRFAGLFPRV